VSWAEIGNARRTWAVAAIGTLFILALGYGRHWKHAASMAPAAVSPEMPTVKQRGLEKPATSPGSDKDGKTRSLLRRPDPMLASLNFSL
jgi:hypothetical protein